MSHRRVGLRVRIIRILNQRRNFRISVLTQQQTGHRWQTDYGWLQKERLVRAVMDVDNNMDKKENESENDLVLNISLELTILKQFSNTI